MVVDHLNDDPADNRLSNLAVNCEMCDTMPRPVEIDPNSKDHCFFGPKNLESYVSTVQTFGRRWTDVRGFFTRRFSMRQSAHEIPLA